MQHIFKQEGDQVVLNDEIGATGKSGNASNLAVSEDHLHFEIRLKAEPGMGLVDRISPIKIFEKCPLTYSIPG
jgi:murein DD-endopeptidase MepM/ murein hydrolase activator NlpD